MSTGAEMGGQAREITSSVDRRKDSLRVVVNIPLGELMAHLGPREGQFEARLRQYFGKLIRDVIEVGELIADEAATETGQVKWFNEDKGYGFITSIESEDVFVHWRGIAGDGFKVLKAGQLVRFKRRRGRESMEAIDVRLVPEAE